MQNTKKAFDLKVAVRFKATSVTFLLLLAVLLAYQPLLPVSHASGNISWVTTGDCTFLAGTTSCTSPSFSISANDFVFIYEWQPTNYGCSTGFTVTNSANDGTVFFRAFSSTAWASYRDGGGAAGATVAPSYANMLTTASETFTIKLGSPVPAGNVCDASIVQFNGGPLTLAQSRTSACSSGGGSWGCGTLITWSQTFGGAALPEVAFANTEMFANATLPSCNPPTQCSWTYTGTATGGGVPCGTNASHCTNFAISNSGSSTVTIANSLTTQNPLIAYLGGTVYFDQGKVNYVAVTPCTFQQLQCWVYPLFFFMVYTTLILGMAKYGDVPERDYIGHMLEAFSIATLLGVVVGMINIMVPMMFTAVQIIRAMRG